MDEAELTVRLIMDHKEACQVLGRAGSNIKTLRDETGSKIVLSNKEYKRRVLTITDKKKQVMKAVGRLSEILESEVNSYGASSRLVPISLTMIIPKNICGFIVGKKGETIKELRVQSGAQIALAVECLPKSDERTCKITGNNFAVITAVDLIIGKIIEAAIQEGKGELKGTSSAEIVPFDPAKETDDSNLNEQDQKLVQMAGAFLAASSGMMASSTDYVPIEIDDQTQELRVPEDHIGAIIGKGGKRINEVRQLSGCKVKIERDDSSGVRRITLNGDQQKIVMATYLINQSITAYSSAKPVHEKLNVKRKGDDYKTDINNLSSADMGHEKQVAMAMQAFFSSQFASADPSNYAGPNEYVPEVKGEAKLEVIDNPFGDNKAPPDMFVVPEKRPRLHY